MEWAYCPRRIEAREGQQSGVVTKALANVTPSAARRVCTLGRQATERASRSSVRMTMMFGDVEASVVRCFPVSLTRKERLRRPGNRCPGGHVSQGAGLRRARGSAWSW